MPLLLLVLLVIFVNYFNRLNDLQLYLFIYLIFWFSIKNYNKSLRFNFFILINYIGILILLFTSYCFKLNIFTNVINYFIFTGFYHFFLDQKENFNFSKYQFHYLLIGCIILILIVFSNPFGDIFHFSNASSVLYSFIIILMFFVYDNTLLEKKSKIAFVVFILFFSILLLKFQARAAIFAVLISISLNYLIPKIKLQKIPFLKLLISLFGIVSLILIILTFNNKSKLHSITSRKLIYENCLNLNRGDKIIFGNGIGSFTSSYFNFVINKNRNSDVVNEKLLSKAFLNSPLNEYLLVYVEYGLIGVMILIIFFYYYFYSYFKSNDSDSINKLKFTFFIFFILISFFNFGFLQLSFIPFFAFSLSSNHLNDFKFFKFMHLKSIKTLFSTLLIIIIISIILLFKINEYQRLLSDRSPKSISDSELFYSNNNYFLKRKLIIDYFKNNEIENTIKIYELSSSKAFQDNFIFEILAKAYENKNEFDKSEKLLEINMNLEPAKFKPKVLLYLFFIKHNQYEKSEKLYQNNKNFPIKINNSNSFYYKNIFLYLHEINKYNLKKL